MINHDGDSLDCVHCFSGVFDANTVMWWHCDDENITLISDLSKGVYFRESQKTTDVLFAVYIRTSHMIKHSSLFSRICNHVQNQSYEESN